MRSAWFDALRTRGARVEGDRVVAFDGRDPREEAEIAARATIVADLSHRALVRADGSDAESFLQAQLAGDVREIIAGRTRLSAYCTPKGRVLGLFRLFRVDAAIHLECEPDAKPAALVRLRMMVLRAKVALEDAEDALIRVGIAGPRAFEIAAHAAGIAPSEEAETVRESGGLALLTLAGPTPRVAIAGARDAMERVWDLLRDAGAVPTGAAAFDLGEMRDGQPRLHAATQEAFLPQFLNLDELSGVSFSKGCFPGQEVVARTKYLGTVVRRMYVARTEAAPPDPGTPIRALRPDGDRDGGVVVASALSVEDSALLIVSPVAEIDAGHALRLGSPEGPAVYLERTDGSRGSGLSLSSK